MLTLSEKLLLLGLHDKKGSVVFSASTALPYGLAGALLIELYLSRRIDFIDKNIKVINADKVDNELLDEVRVLISSSSTLRDAKYWLKTIHSKVKAIQGRLASQLVEKKILSKKEHSFIWLIHYNRYPSRDVKPEQNLRAHIKSVVLKGAQASEEDIALLSLVQACELVNEVFDSSERKKAQQRIKELVKEQKISKAITQIVDEIMTALMVVIMASTVTTTIASS